MANNPPIRPPSAEHLALAAGSWAAQINSWIPASFASSSSGAGLPKLPDLAEILESAGDENDRLGLGHPSIGKPKSRVPGLKELEKRMMAKAKGKARAEAEAAVDGAGAPDAARRDGVEDGEEESRGRLGGKKRKNVAMDLLGGKKRKPGGAGATTSRNSSAVSTESPSATPTRGHSPHHAQHLLSSDDGAGPSTPPRQTTTSSLGGSGVFPFQGPIAPDSPAAKRVLGEHKPHSSLVARPESADEDESMSPPRANVFPTAAENELGEGGAESLDHGGMSKSALRRVKRKARKGAVDDTVP